MFFAVVWDPSCWSVWLEHFRSKNFYFREGVNVGIDNYLVTRSREPSWITIPLICQEILIKKEIKNQWNLYSQHGAWKCSCFRILIVYCYFGNKFPRKTNCVCSNDRVLIVACIPKTVLYSNLTDNQLLTLLDFYSYKNPWPPWPDVYRDVYEIKVTTSLRVTLWWQYYTQWLIWGICNNNNNNKNNNKIHILRGGLHH